MHLARRITSLWSACLCRQELVRLQKWVPLNNLKTAKNYTRMKSSRVKSFRKKPLKWRRVVVASTVRESAKVWKFGRVYFKLIVFQIDHFSLKRLTVTSVIPIVQLEFSKICLPQPSTRLSLMFLPIFKAYSNQKTWGRTSRTCPPMTDFYRKVNKFSQKFIKCDPCLPPSSFF